MTVKWSLQGRELIAAVAWQDRGTAPAVSGQESTEVKNMSLYLSQRCWGRSCLHLAAVMRAGIGREIHFTRMPLNGHTTAGG
jgi:hypothetical protein